jgi:hypothetical protein
LRRAVPPAAARAPAAAMALATAMALAALLPRAGAGKEPSRSQAPAKPSGLVEKTGVSLVLLDIEAVDADGRPVRGLEPADFVVRRNGRLWPVVSVDDFCPCVPSGEKAGAVTTAPDAAASGAAAPGSGERPLFILYLDFGQLRPDGRHEALDAARRWVREVRAADEPAMIAAYVTSKGLLVLSQPSADRDALLRVLDAADRDTTFVDPFAYDLERRLDECHLHPETCADDARLEYAHGRRALEAFRLFLARLRGRPGPKVVLYFHENGMMVPGRIYLPPEAGTRHMFRDDASHFMVAEGVGAEATAARTVVYPLMAGVGPLGDAMGKETLGLGATLAEATGGAYNLGASDFARLASTAGRGCRCRYVLGLEPVEAYSSTVSSVSVTARGVRLRPLYRMRLMPDEDAWLRKAGDVLQDPQSARDLPVGAALVPLGAGDRGWDVAAQVAVDLDALVLLPLGIQNEGRWEIGARLMRLDGHGTWDMHATAVASTDIGGPVDAVLLHSHEFTALHPGRYRLTAFIRDNVANVFGGAEAVIELPDLKRGGVAGPVLLDDCPVRITSPLPLASGSPSPGTDDGTAMEIKGTRNAGPAPIAPLPVRRGSTLLFESWICAAAGLAPGETIGLLTRDEVPLFRLSEHAVQTKIAGPCRRHVDEVPTAGLDPGQFLYVLRGSGATGGTTTWSAPFVVAPPEQAAD